MKLLSSLVLAAGLLAACQVPAQAKIYRSIEKTFAVESGGTIRIDTAGGNISVEPSTDGVVKVVAKETIRADSDSEADSILKTLKLSIDQLGRDIVVSSRCESSVWGFHFGFGPPVEVDFVVTVPADYAADLKTSGGNIEVGDLAGTVRAHTSGGNIRLGRLKGDARASTSGGDVSLKEGEGAVDLHTSGGRDKGGAGGGSGEPLDLGRKRGDRGRRKHALGVDKRRGHEGVDRGKAEGRLRTGDLGRNGQGHRGPGGRIQSRRSDERGRCQGRGPTITIGDGGIGKSSLAGSVNGGGPRLRLRSSGGDIEVKAL